MEGEEDGFERSAGASCVMAMVLAMVEWRGDGRR